MRQSNAEIKKQRDALHSTVVGNVLAALIKKRDYLGNRKLEAYIPYREAREEMRKHDEFTRDVQARGIEALL